MSSRQIGIVLNRFVSASLDQNDDNTELYRNKVVGTKLDVIVDRDVTGTLSVAQLILEYSSDGGDTWGNATTLDTGTSDGSSTTQETTVDGDLFRIRSGTLTGTGSVVYTVKAFSHSLG